MPIPDQFGTQAPIELLRQILGQGGFYDIKKLIFMKLEGCVYLSSCGPPGGGRNFVTPRLLRYFHRMWMPDLNKVSMTHIYNSILEGFLRKKTSSNIREYSNTIVNKTIDIFYVICG